MKTKCKAAIKESPFPGLIRCANWTGRGRDDGLCTLHGKRKDASELVVMAVPDAPTRDEAFITWQTLTFDEKRQAREDSKVSFDVNKMSVSQWELACWLQGWRMKKSK